MKRTGSKEISKKNTYAPVQSAHVPLARKSDDFIYFWI